MHVTDSNIRYRGRTDADRREARRSSGRRRPTSLLERREVVAVAVVAGVAVGFADSAPTETFLMDYLMRFAVAFVVTLAASRAKRWTWLVLAGFSVVGSSAGWDLVPAAVAVAIAVVGSLVDRRRISGALVAALAVQSLFRMPDMGFLGSSTAFGAIAVLPVLVSSYMQLGTVGRGRVYKSAFALLGVWIVGSAVFGLAVLLSWNAANNGVNLAKDGVSAVGDSDTARAADLFAGAEASLERANSVANAWWVAPAKLVPVVAQQTRVLASVTSGGAELSGSAGRAVREADVQSFRYESGVLDLAAVEAAQEPARDVVRRLDAVTADLRDVASPWLLSPVRSKLDRLSVEVDNALGQARIAQLAVDNLPGLMGAEGPRNYMVLFTQPAETRGLGGFVGSWATLSATDGRLELTGSGRARDINEAPGREDRRLSGPDEYIERYGKFQPARYFQDLTFSPDFQTVATVVAEVVPQAGMQQLDGVIAVDPTGLAALLELTGPIRVPETQVTLDAETAADFLMSGQYAEFGDDDTDEGERRDEREDFLERAGRLTFEKLVAGSLPSPLRLGEAIGPAVSGRHIMFQSFHGTEQDLFRALGSGGEIERASGSDYLGLVTQNKGNNKIDVFMYRAIDYRVTFDPATGMTTSKATITLRNDAPSSGLPEAVIGSNDQGLPPGTNSMYLSLYTPLRLGVATVDGEEVEFEFQHEFGYAVYSRFVEIPPGGTTTVVLDLTGKRDPGPTYDLTVASQPVPNPDLLTVSVQPTAGASVVGANGLGIVRGGIKAAGSATLDRVRRFGVDFVW